MIYDMIEGVVSCLQWMLFHLCKTLVIAQPSALTFKVHLEDTRSGRTFMLRLEIASAFVFKLKTVRIPGDEW